MISNTSFCSRGATALAIAICAGASLSGGVATAFPEQPGPDLPEWYVANQITADRCKSPITLDSDNVQLTCHTKVFEPASLSALGTGRWGYILEADVSVPAAGQAVDVATYDADDKDWLKPIHVYRITPGTSRTIEFNQFDCCEDGQSAGRTVVVRAPLFTESDFTVTVHPHLMG